MLFNKEYSESVITELSSYISVIMKWTDEVGRLKIRTNVDDLNDAEFTVKFGADGIGLCRTESTFLRPKRISAVMKMILADSEKERNEAISVLLPLQTADFKKLFETVGEKPIAIRLLDSLPYHEFETALGHRGCLLAIALSGNSSDADRGYNYGCDSGEERKRYRNCTGNNGAARKYGQGIYLCEEDCHRYRAALF